MEADFQAEIGVNAGVGSADHMGQSDLPAGDRQLYHPGTVSVDLENIVQDFLARQAPGHSRFFHGGGLSAW